MHKVYTTTLQALFSRMYWIFLYIHAHAECTGDFNLWGTLVHNNLLFVYLQEIVIFRIAYKDMPPPTHPLNIGILIKKKFLNYQMNHYNIYTINLFINVQLY